jgi:hypothetical protein
LLHTGPGVCPARTGSCRHKTSIVSVNKQTPYDKYYNMTDKTASCPMQIEAKKLEPGMNPLPPSFLLLLRRIVVEMKMPEEAAPGF